MTRYTAETLDLSRLGAPFLVPVDFERALSERLAELQALWAAARAKNSALPPLDTLMLETEPAVILQQADAYREILVRGAINDAANTLRLATATGADLDHLAVTYFNTPRLILDAGVPGERDPVLESDAELRERAQLAGEAFPHFGLTQGGYSWRVRRLFGDRVRGVRALRRPGGNIHLVVLARGGDGAPAETLIGDIQAGFNDDEAASNSTDVVTVFPAVPLHTHVDVVLGIPPGPDPASLIPLAREALRALAASRHNIGDTLHVQAIGAAATLGPVRYVRVLSPAADVAGGDAGAPFVASINVTTEISE